jgi:NADPH-dependent glutamate synthase beta subunit-like oxidoreductase/2,4-dienoyl-CoA reductase-like NADH-dependent reductase (Old Yellow Enzyme family)
MIASNTHAPFRLANLNDLKDAIQQLGLDIRVEENVSILAQTVSVAGQVIPNRMAIQPMEGCDGTADGAPNDLTFRRYKRFAAGGAGLLWFEACAVVPEGRANPRQLWIHQGTKDKFARLLEESKKAAAESMGNQHRPFTVLQLTHSGRYSKPGDDPKPIIAYHDPILDADRGISPDYPLVTDEYLDSLEDAYVEAAKLAFEVGFDAVDIKACHRYLMNELLAAYTREGKYGGSYENRTRLLKNVVRRVIECAGPNGIVTCRLGIHDAHPYPYGWGMDPKEPMKPNLEEPKRLVRELYELGVPIINITMGNPYFNPHVNRPYDRPIEGGRYPEEHPLVGVGRLIGLTREIQKHVPEIVVVGSGYSWLRNLWPYVAAASIREGAMQIVGLGRQAFAYPGFAKEIIETGRLERRHTCITCSSCTQIMRDGGMTGCVPFDSEVYGPIYREGRRNSLDWAKTQASRCRDCFDPTCKDGCPAGIDIPGFVRALANGDVKRSYEILRERNVLPELCAYVCPADVQCQANCIESIFSENPIPIRELQRFVSRTARKKNWAGIGELPAPTGKRVAVIGAGPAGLACSLKLIEKGHCVHLFDKNNSLGGLAARAIPKRRLIIEEFENEAVAIFGELGQDRFVFRGGEGLTNERNLDWFVQEYDAVFLAPGLTNTVPLPGPRPTGVEDAVSFLERAKRGEAVVPKRVAVLGGGNTAMDAATTARSLGARDVYLVYRRSFIEMPAWPDERNEALEMGVHFLLLTQPIRYVANQADHLTGIVVARTILGEPDESGRRRPIVVTNSESILEVEMALEALGQELPKGFEELVPGVELTADRLIKIDEMGRTSRPGVFSGGDAANGGTTVVRAVADGMRAAEGIHSLLNSKNKK